MLAHVREVGAMPFMLFEYYLTYQTAPDGIRPSLETIALDLGIVDKKGRPSKSAVCNLKKILIDKKWIREENGRIVILKSFRNSERHSEKMNDLSEFLNEPFRNSERPYIRTEKEKKEVKKEKEVPNGTMSGKPDAVAEIFAHWQKILNHPKTTLTKDRRGKIKARLAEKFTVEDLKLAIEGCRGSPFHQGDNERGEIYDSIDLIFRNAEKTEQFIRIAKNEGRNGSNQTNGTTNGNGGKAVDAHLKPRLISSRQTDR